MAIITISRGTFTGGLRLAELMAQGLGYPLVSREQLYTNLQRNFGFTQEEISDILDRIPTGARFAAERSRGSQLGEKRRRLVAGLTACLCDLVQGGEAVYHGYAGHLLLPDISHVLRIRVIAPHCMRVKMIVERKAISPMEAGRYIDRMDSERERWTRFVFGVDWSDPSLFDLTLNLESMEMGEAAEIAMVAARLERFRPTGASLKKTEELSRSNREAALMAKSYSLVSGAALSVGNCEHLLKPAL